MIRIEHSDVRTVPSFEGIQVEDDEWHLDPAKYRAFTESVTGIALTEELSAADCYRIGNLLEAFVAERKRDGEWNDSLVEQYPDIDSLEEIVTLAQFLRTCHDQCPDARARCN
ncbi:hypothetical protein [Haloarcula laminariae]|uniref:hypothetical protein n=1 Tax=Haloarcula laminariae TaxID=2961577 RepID=UPI0024063C33|nr:hypothetical protein [Halomicroarcula sp. FL173]